MNRLLIAISLLCSFVANAQQNGSQEQMNLVKMNLTSVIFRNYQFAYERLFTKRFSVQVSYGFIPAGQIPFGSALNPGRPRITTANNGANRNSAAAPIASRSNPRRHPAGAAISRSRPNPAPKPCGKVNRAAAKVIVAHSVNCTAASNSAWR